MIQFEELKLELDNLKPQVLDLAEAIGLDNINREVNKLESQSSSPDFWNDVSNSQKVLKKLAC